MTRPQADGFLQPARDARRITILGATGSVGRNTLDLVARNRAGFEVVALTANTNAAGLAEQARRIGARLAVVADPTRYAELKDALAGSGIEAAAGAHALVDAAQRPADWVMAAIVGAAGLAPTVAALRQGACLGLANKEALVCAGELVLDEAARSGATLLPVDSEHSAIFQVLHNERIEDVEKIVLTASGGPFRTLALAEMAGVTPARAVAHPNWDMGAKISVDSATMMNKGLELIEAHHLFGLPDQRIEILVHPQSVIHSMVAYRDGSVLAQLGAPDMRTPIAYALSWPKRMAAPVERLDLARIGSLSFEPPDEARFPALRLARAALRAGGGAPAVLNAANEVAVQAFLHSRIGFLDIAAIAEETLAAVAAPAIPSFEAVVALDGAARRHAEAALAKRAAAG